MSNVLHLLQAHTYLSADSVTDDDDPVAYPEEFLNTLAPNGMPPHSLTLKVGAPIMLLRNLNSAQGQANGTRLICRGFHKHVIDAELCTGPHAGERVFLPRIQLKPSDDDMPFTLARRQFPIRPAFAMTINKAHGQMVCICLRKFSPTVNYMWPRLE